MADLDLLRSKYPEHWCLLENLNRLTDPAIHQDWLDGGFLHTTFDIRRYCVGEFIRKFDEKFPYWVLPNRYKSICTTEVKLWVEVYRLVEEVFRYYPGTYDHPATWFHDIVYERQLVFFFAFNDSEDINKGTFLKKIRGQNQQLWTLKGSKEDLRNSSGVIEGDPFESIPFDRQDAPATWQLIWDAMALLEEAKKHDFRKRFYTPMVIARRAHTTFVASPGSQLLIPGEDGCEIKNWGGRRSQNE